MNEANGRMYFEYQFSDTDPKITMSISPESDLTHVLEAFDQFLHGAGFSFTGVVDILGE